MVSLSLSALCQEIIYLFISEDVAAKDPAGDRSCRPCSGPLGPSSAQQWQKMGSTGRWFQGLLQLQASGTNKTARNYLRVPKKLVAG